MLHAIASAFIGVATFISSLFGVYAAPQVQPDFGAALPSGTAVFETSLQSRISSTDTSLTLVSASVRGGSSLSGYQCFTLDEGRTDGEYVCGSVSGTSVTALERGIDPATGTTTNSTLQFAHRVGADVKITDFPLIARLRAVAAGTDTFPHTIHYAAGVTPTATGDLTDKEYVDGVAFSGAGVIDASTVAKGVSELATQVETASSTAQGGSGVLVIPASSATSTYNTATAPLRVVVTDNSGKIDTNFVATSTLFATSSIASGPIGYVGKNMQVFTSTGTTTFSVPAGVVKISVEVQGAGGNGGGCSNAVTAGAGAGSGGWSYRSINVSATTTIQLYVGTAGQWTTFGTNGFYMIANSGANGSTAGSGSTATQGGVGGTASGGDINAQGSAGGNGTGDAAAAASFAGGVGASSRYGGGGQGAVGTGSAGQASGNYGGGGGGASCGSAGSQSGGNGAQGLVRVSW